MPGLLVILREPFSDLGGSGADNVVLTCVIVSFAFEDFNSQGAFFYLLALASQTAIYNVTKQILTAGTSLERRMSQYSFQLLTDCRLFQVSR